MPVYEVTVRGEKVSRVVRASTAAKARDHVVDAVSINADKLADLIAAGATVETASEGDPEPSGGKPAGDAPASTTAKSE